MTEEEELRGEEVATGYANANQMSLTPAVSESLPVKRVLEHTVIALGVIGEGGPLDSGGFLKT